MESNPVDQIVVFIVLIAISSFFSVSEMAYSSASSTRLKQDAEVGNKKAAQAVKLLQKPDELFYTFLLGKNIVKVASAVVASLFFIDHFPTYGVPLAIIVTTSLLLLLGEITPKLIGKIYPESIATRFATILHILIRLLSPLVWVFQKWQLFLGEILPVADKNRISEEELLSIVDEAHLDGSIELKEHRLVKAAIEFDDRDIASILTPRADVVGFDINDSLEEIEQLFLNTPFSRLVVYNESLDEIIGTIHGKDFFRYIHNREKENYFSSLHNLITKPLFVPTTISLSNLLTSMQENHTHIGIIVDEYGRMIGIATMEDVLEELVGEIWDESDIVRSTIKKLNGDNEYLIEGTYSLEKFFNLFSLAHENEEDWHSNTVSGFIMEVFDHIPVNNEVLYYNNLKITIVNAQKQRVNEVVVKQIN